MGPVSRANLIELAESPNGEAGFRNAEVSAAAVKNGWMRVTSYLSSRVTYYAITDAGREALRKHMTKRKGRA